MAETDKVTRVLMMYSMFIEGRKIYKQSFCKDMGINRRTFDRDIEDIRLFFSETYTGEEVVYDRQEESYYLKNRYQKKELSGMEITCIFESIRESRGLRKDEYRGLISNIADTCEKKQSLLLKKIAERYIASYQNDEVTEAVMKMQWDLQQCIIEKDKIMLNMITGDKKVVSPVALHIYEGQYYLFAYDKKETLLVITMTDIECFQMQYSKYEDELIEKFDSINFMEIKDLMRKEKIKMANIRFPLIMKDGKQVRELEELQKYFDLEKAVEYFASGKLQKWLESTYNDDILDEISELTGEEEDFVSRFTEALGVNLEDVEIKAGGETFDAQRSIRESNIKEGLKSLVPLDEIEELIPLTVESQEWFETYVKEGKDRIYLLAGEYFIPKWMKDIRIEGIGEVTARVEAENKEEFVKQNVNVVKVKPADERTEGIMVVDAISSNMLELLGILKRMIDKKGGGRDV